MRRMKIVTETPIKIGRFFSSNQSTDVCAFVLPNGVVLLGVNVDDVELCESVIGALLDVKPLEDVVVVSCTPKLR